MIMEKVIKLSYKNSYHNWLSRKILMVGTLIIIGKRLHVRYMYMGIMYIFCNDNMMSHWVPKNSFIRI